MEKQFKCAASLLALSLVLSAVLPHFAQAEESPTVKNSSEIENQLDEFTHLLKEMEAAGIDLQHLEENTDAQINELSPETQNVYYEYEKNGAIHKGNANEQQSSMKSAEAVPPKAEMQHQVQPQIWASITKKAVQKALRYGGTYAGDLIKRIPYKWADKAGDSISKYGNKAADVLEELNNFTESAVALGLTKAGIPPADALYIAKFIVFFLG
ncbi:hypothetical protein ACE1TI_02995 [Alteribacillus sp. JSM 102045]|uniref:hypothetical protein n=1 Tax=Alteribacillus sp. JSM 102045 TaxID=1562101 RepID=UPI0035BF5FF9